MKMRRLPALAAILVLLGCSHYPDIVGKWSIRGGPGVATLTFQPDGYYKAEAVLPGRTSSVTGQYQMEGSQLRLKGQQQRTATVSFRSADEMTMTGDDGVPKTLIRVK